VRDATRFALAARHVGTQRFDNDQTNTAARMPAYSLVDLKVVQLGGSWNTALMLSNLFDRRYSSYGIVTPEPGGASFYPQRGRTLLLTVDRRF
jgi:outer membrane receptor protein involved in Fe transport